jgi:hypothetical protein
MCTTGTATPAPTKRESPARPHQKSKSSMAQVWAPHCGHPSSKLNLYQVLPCLRLRTPKSRARQSWVEDGAHCLEPMPVYHVNLSRRHRSELWT